MGGEPGSYKTTALWNLAIDMVTRKQRVLYIALEPTPGELAVLALSRFSRVPGKRLEMAQGDNGAQLSDDEERRVHKAGEQLAEMELHLRMHGAAEQGRTLDDVMRSATRARFDAIFIDHVGMIGRDSGDELRQLADAIDRLRALTDGEVVKDYRPFVCAISPLNGEGMRKGKDRLPQLADFRGSNRIYYDADLAMILRKREVAHADESDEPDVVDGFVLKNRQERCPVVLQFEAQGAIGFVTERLPEMASQPEHWSDQGEP